MPACHSERPREFVLTEATGPVLSSVEGSEESSAGRAGVVVGAENEIPHSVRDDSWRGGMDDGWGGGMGDSWRGGVGAASLSFRTATRVCVD